MNISNLKGKKVVFAASGGLDSCTITHWLSSQDINLICMTADLGQPDEEDFFDIEKRMLASGASEFVSIPLQKEMAEIGLEVIQAQACYEGRYWNITGAARCVIIRGILSKRQTYSFDVLSHGATGRGNDQVRFQIIAAMHQPDLQFYAPWRDELFLDSFKGRKAMLDYCNRNDIPVKASPDEPYSTDANLLGLTHEGGLLEELQTPIQIVTPGMGVWPKDSKSKPEHLTVRFEQGRPTELNGVKMELHHFFPKLNKIGGSHGIGIAEHLVENRFVGVKSRGVYEAPGMEILGTCYEYLLQLVLDRRARQLFENLSRYLSVQLYQGYWDDLGSQAARKSISEIAQFVTGTVEIELYRGNISYIRMNQTPHSLYTNEGSMEDEGEFDHRDSEGLLNILTISARTQAKAGIIKQI